MQARGRPCRCQHNNLSSGARHSQATSKMYSSCFIAPDIHPQTAFHFGNFTPLLLPCLMPLYLLAPPSHSERSLGAVAWSCLSPRCPVITADATGKSHVKMFLRIRSTVDGLQHHFVTWGPQHF